MRVQVSRVIHRPVDEVFTFLADLERSAPVARDMISARALTDGPRGVGTRFRCLYRDPFGTHETVLEMTEYEPGKRMALCGRVGPFNYVGRERLEPTSDGTRLTRTVDISMPGPVALLTLPLAPLARRGPAPHGRHHGGRLLTLPLAPLARREAEAVFDRLEIALEAPPRASESRADKVQERGHPAEGSSTHEVPEDAVLDVHRTTCCIVGAGPAGAVLALLLARQGIPVTLLEAHGDFDRDFRGDTVHPAILEILDQIGLADRLLAEVPHAKIRTGSPPGAGFVVEFGRLKTRFPFIAMIPQVRFLEFVTTEAARSPTFRLVMGAPVRELVEEDGVVRGVRYRSPEGWHEVRALLTVGADGRFSRMRQLAGLPPAIKTSQPIDILWFRLPRRPSDPEGAQGRFSNGAGMVMLDRGDLWQMGYILPKGGYQRLRESGLEHLREVISLLAPWLSDRVGELRDWHQASLLSVESDFLPRWYRAGLLLIGDAAHVMSPMGGNGINYAVQDAAAAANFLSGPLKTGRLRVADLAAVQRRRGWPTRVTQMVVNQIQDRVITGFLRARGPVTFPVIGRLLLRTPVLRDLPLNWMAFGLWPVHLRPEIRSMESPRLISPRFDRSQV